MNQRASSLRTTMVFHRYHGWYASFWRLAYLFILGIPPLLAFVMGTFVSKGGMIQMAAGCVMLLPAVIVLVTEGWSGAFTCTAVASFFAYLMYCNAPILFGNALLAPTVEDYPHFGLSLREEAAYINLVGCGSMAAGLILGYHPPAPVSAVDRLRPGKLYVPDLLLRNSVIGITAAFVLVRLFLIVKSGDLSIGAFLAGGRSSGDYVELAGPFSFVLNLASVFQVTAVLGGALLLARRSKVKWAKLVAYVGILTPILERALRGGRGQVIGYLLALIAFAVTIPIPRLQDVMKKAMPFIFAFLILGFAVMTVIRSEGVGGTKDVDVTEGLRDLVYYDQFTAMEQCLYLYPNLREPIGGETLLALPANPIPRTFYPNKPRDLGVILPGELKDRATATLSAGLIGEGWANFLWWGAVLLPLGVGFFAGIWDRLRNVGSRWSDGYALWAAAIPGIFFIVRGSFMIGGNIIMYSVAGMFMMLIISGRMRDPDVDKTTRV
ncbi:MAG: oligosaccharide repeat unit polymerase [Planctomycetes bacterium]|nr:oligosaccharide repeat unit polymerase [Planctomycetota bacterium]